MKGIYMCVGIDLQKPHSGIANKIKSHIRFFEEQGVSMEIVSVDNKTNILDKFLFFIPGIMSSLERREMNSVDRIDIGQYDFVYIRKPALSKGMVELVKKIKLENEKCKILMEIPTYPFYGEYKGFRKLLIYKSKAYEKKISKYIDRIITFSDDNMIWDTPTIRISNGIDIRKITPKQDLHCEGIINMIGVATLSHWHGYDRMIEGLNNYYKSGGNENIRFYIVGESNVKKYYQELVDKYCLKKHVILCGAKYGEELNSLYDICEMGVDALARHRAGVIYNSSLKGKEYGAKGLAIISGVVTELDKEKSYKYYMRVPADDTPIDIDSVLDFYHQIFDKNCRDNIINEIRLFTEGHFDYNKVLLPVWKYLTKHEEISSNAK